MAVLFFIIYLYFAFHNTVGDFIQFQAAHRAFSSGLNPYDPVVMLELQKSINSNQYLALMMWTLPWILPLICPLGFDANIYLSLYQWTIISSLLLTSSVIILLVSNYNSYCNRLALFISLIVAFFSAPFLDVLRLHQTTPIFILSLSLFVLTIKNQKNFLSGLSMSIWLIKPHLFILMFVCWFLSLKNFKSFIASILGLCAGCLVLSLLSEIIYPGSNLMWLNTLSFSESSTYDTVSRISWRGANLFGFLRGHYPTTHPLLLLLPSLIICISLTFAHFRTNFTLRLLDDLGWIIPLSLFIAPYGWFYDHALSVVSTLLTIKIADSNEKLGIIFTLTVLYNIFTGIYYLYLANMQHDLWWYPLGCLIIHIAARAKASKPEEMTTC